MSDTEDAVENHLVRRVKALRGECPKLYVRRWPDRAVYLPGGVHALCETKRPKGGRYQPGQLRQHARLRKLGHLVYVCHTKALVDQMLAALVAGSGGNRKTQDTSKWPMTPVKELNKLAP